MFCALYFARHLPQISSFNFYGKHILQRQKLRLQSVTLIVANNIPTIEPSSLQILKLSPPSCYLFGDLFISFSLIPTAISSSPNILVHSIRFFVFKCLFRKCIFIFWALIFHLLIYYYIIYLILFVTFSSNIVFNCIHVATCII